jgi:thioredoxin 1
MAVQEVNSNDFDEKISKGKSLVDYHGLWCAPCKVIAPIIEELSTEIKDIKFYKLDVDKSPDVASQYEVMGIPTLILFKDGKEIKRIVGLRSKEDLKKELK